MASQGREGIIFWQKMQKKKFGKTPSRMNAAPAVWRLIRRDGTRM
jgi:hypothetical protein